MYKFVIPYEIFIPWFRSEDYNQYVSYKELQKAYEEGLIEKGGVNHVSNTK